MLFRKYPQRYFLHNQKAALALNYAQSTITFQIKQLEKELGIQLFEKKGTHMVLTDAGHEVQPLIDQVIQASEALLYHGESTDGLHGSLKIALPETLVIYQLQDVLKEFKTRAPHVRLSLQVRNCFEIYDRFLDGESDLAIHYNVHPYPQNFQVRPLLRVPLVMVGSPQLTAEEADFITPDQKKKLCLLHGDPNALYMKMLDAYLKSRRIILSSSMDVWSVEAVKRCIMSNLGVSYLPRFAVEEELADGRLRELSLDSDDEFVTAICIYRKNRWQSPAMELFLEILFRCFLLK